MSKINDFAKSGSYIFSKNFDNKLLIDRAF